MSRRRPDHLKLIAGTARADRAAPPGRVLPTIDAVPPAPDWLPNAFAAKEWRRLAPQLVGMKTLTEGNIGTFAQFCALHGRLVQCWSAGTTPTAALISAYRALGGDLGLTRLSAPAGKPERDDLNIFAKHGNRSPGKAGR